MPRRSILTWTIPLLLALQLGMLWIQGAQLHQQNQLLRDLRGDIQDLADSLDSGQDSSDAPDDTSVQPLQRVNPPHRRFQRVARLNLQEDADAASQEARKELEETRKSGQDAVRKAREDQAKLSWEENARKAEEARKVRGATDAWQRWSLIGLGVLVLAWIVRAYLRRR